MYTFSTLEKMPSKEGFLGIPESLSVDPHAANIVVVPFGLERSVTYGTGAAKGPQAIIQASHEVELFDEALWCEPYKKIGITTLKEFPIPHDLEDALEHLDKIIECILSVQKTPLTFGGEHSITAGAIRPFTRQHKEITILHFDAHADLRDGYQNEKFSHAAALRRCLDYENVKLVSLGIRNISEEEAHFLTKNSERIKIFWAKDKDSWDINEILSYLKEPIYLTFDLDAFDSSLMPATGTPEPGGLFWDEVIKIITAVCRTRRIIGVDINELAPLPSLHACEFLAAKLAYKIISLMYCS
jgi:agmatinase